MKCLVTGGAGFIGSHLVERLLFDGNLVLVLDNLSMGKVENLPVNENLQLHVGSILDEDTDRLYKNTDVVFHLAALTRPQVSLLKPKKTTRTNVEGTLNVIRNCIENKVKRLVFVSSSSVYGDQEKYPEAEDVIPNPMSPYALSKLVGEEYCKMYEKLDGLKANYIRPFNVYGKRQNPEGGYGAAVPNFFEALRGGTQPYITGDGEQRRDFTYIEDVIEIIMLASQCDVFGEAFNAGAGHNYSVNEVYQTIAKALGKTIAPKYVEAVVEPRTTLADISKCQRLLGWEPRFSLEEGIRRMV